MTSGIGCSQTDKMRRRRSTICALQHISISTHTPIYHDGFPYPVIITRGDSKPVHSASSVAKVNTLHRQNSFQEALNR